MRSGYGALGLVLVIGCGGGAGKTPDAGAAGSMGAAGSVGDAASKPSGPTDGGPGDAPPPGCGLRWLDNGLGRYQDNTTQVLTRAGRVEIDHDVFVDGAGSWLNSFYAPEPGDGAMKGYGGPEAPPVSDRALMPRPNLDTAPCKPAEPAARRAGTRFAIGSPS